MTRAVALARMLAAAEAAGGPGHHFGVLQLPMNFFEPGGILESNNPPNAPETARRSVRELASTKGIGVLVNRPLNAVVGRGMVRLADFPDAPASPADRHARLGTPRGRPPGLRGDPQPPPGRGVKKARVRQRPGARSSSGRTSVAKRVIDSSSYGAGKPARRCR